MNTNTLSPQNNYIYNVNNKENDNVSPKLHNIPGSVQRTCKYKNCYILNNLNNYQPNVIIGNKTKPNKYTNIIINKNNEIIIDNDSDNNNKNINGSPSINNNLISDSNENTLVKSPINCLNTITFNINNNYNNCCNNYINENNSETDYIKFDGFKVNGLGSVNNKSLSNLNEISNFNSREKILKKLTEQDEHLDVNINPIKNQNNNKRSTLFKAKSKTKIKSSQNIYSNTTNSNTNNTKKSNKTSINNTNSLNNNNTSNTNNKINGDIKNKNDTNDNVNHLNENDKNKIYLETNSNNNTNSYSNINNKGLLYETVDDNKCNDDYFNNIKNNILNSNNKRNYEKNFKEFEVIKPINSMNCFQKEIKDNNNDNADKNNLENNESKNLNVAFQTYSGPFRNNLIKVNMIEKENKNIKNESDHGLIGDITESLKLISEVYQNKEKDQNKDKDNSFIETEKLIAKFIMKKNSLSASEIDDQMIKINSEGEEIDEEAFEVYEPPIIKEINEECDQIIKLLMENESKDADEDVKRLKYNITETKREINKLNDIDRGVIERLKEQIKAIRKESDKLNKIKKIKKKENK